MFGRASGGGRAVIWVFALPLCQGVFVSWFRMFCCIRNVGVCVVVCNEIGNPCVCLF